MNHDNELNHLLRGGRLFQQYVVDMAAKIESDKLNNIRMNQALLRSTTYRGLMDALNDDDDLETSESASSFSQHLSVDRDT